MNNEDKRFVKFGMLDMKSMLNSTSVLAEKSFLIPMLKNVTEIRFNKSDLRFKINLPLKNISQQAFTGIVCADLQSDNVTLDQNCFDVKEIKDGGNVELALTGTINKINSDSHNILKITIAGKTYFTTVVFTRNINADSELQSFPIANASFGDMALISGERKLSRMVRVLDKFHKVNFPEYYFMEKNKQTASATVISLLTKENGKHVIKSISLPRVNKVLSIHRQDINLDGNLDYFIYALSADQKELLFVNLSQNLTPVFGKFSTWSFPLSTFEGLPIDGGQEKFDWVAVTNKDLGRILVPSFYKVFELAELDNSKNILDRVVGKTPRLFFLNPSIVDNKVTLESRVFDSVQTMKTLRKKLQLFSDQSLTLLKSIPQSVEQYTAGTIHALFSSSDENSTKFFEVLFSDKEMRINPIKTNLSISDSLIYPVVNSSDFILTTLLNRSSAEYLLLNQSEISTQSIVKQNWENPILNMIGAFNQNEEKLLFIESRYTISLEREGKASLDLPIYRDSSFPGANFSETLTPLLADGLPGVFVNSTLIFGERLYVMVAEENQFIRPMNLSVAIPDGCVPLTPETLEIHENYNFAFLCSDSSQNVTLKFLPML